MQLRCNQLPVAHTLIVADMPGLSLRGSGYSTLKALPAGSSLYVNLMTCKAAWEHAPGRAVEAAVGGLLLRWSSMC